MTTTCENCGATKPAGPSEEERAAKKPDGLGAIIDTWASLPFPHGEHKTLVQQENAGLRQLAEMASAHGAEEARAPLEAELTKIKQLARDIAEREQKFLDQIDSLEAELLQAHDREAAAVLERDRSKKDAEVENAKLLDALNRWDAVTVRLGRLGLMVDGSREPSEVAVEELTKMRERVRELEAETNKWKDYRTTDFCRIGEAIGLGTGHSSFGEIIDRAKFLLGRIADLEAQLAQAQSRNASLQSDLTYASEMLGTADPAAKAANLETAVDLLKRLARDESPIVREGAGRGLENIQAQKPAAHIHIVPSLDSLQFAEPAQTSQEPAASPSEGVCIKCGPKGFGYGSCYACHKKRECKPAASPPGEVSTENLQKEMHNQNCDGPDEQLGQCDLELVEAAEADIRAAVERATAKDKARIAELESLVARLEGQVPTDAQRAEMQSARSVESRIYDMKQKVEIGLALVDDVLREIGEDPVSHLALPFFQLGAILRAIRKERDAALAEVERLKSIEKKCVDVDSATTWDVTVDNIGRLRAWKPTINRSIVGGFPTMECAKGGGYFFVNDVLIAARDDIRANLKSEAVVWENRCKNLQDLLKRNEKEYEKIYKGLDAKCDAALSEVETIKKQMGVECEGRHKAEAEVERLNMRVENVVETCDLYQAEIQDLRAKLEATEKLSEQRRLQIFDLNMAKDAKRCPADRMSDVEVASKVREVWCSVMGTEGVGRAVRELFTPSEGAQPQGGNEGKP